MSPVSTRGLGGEGDIGRSSEANCGSVEMVGLSFLSGLEDRVGGHGFTALRSGGSFGGVDQTTTIVVGGVSGAGADLPWRSGCPVVCGAVSGLTGETWLSAGTAAVVEVEGPGREG